MSECSGIMTVCVSCVCVFSAVWHVYVCVCACMHVHTHECVCALYVVQVVCTTVYVCMPCSSVVCAVVSMCVCSVYAMNA